MEAISLITALESSSGIIMFSLDINYCYTAFTKSHKDTMQAIWGVEIQVGDCMLDFISEPDKSKARKNFDRSLKGERFTLVEEYGDSKLHRSFWEDRYDPIYDEAGNISGLVVFVLDVTNHLKTTHEVEDLQERLTIALSASQTGVWEWLIKEDRIIWSDQVYEIFKFNKDVEISFSNYTSLIHPDDKERLINNVQETLRTGSKYKIEHRIIIDGELRWIRGFGILHRDNEGNPEKMIGTVQDITEFQKSQQEKRDWETRYKLVSQSSGQMIYDYDIEGGTILWSGNTENILGYSNEEMGDVNQWTKMIHPEDQEITVNELNNAIRNKNTFDVVYRIRTKKGIYKIVSDRGFIHVEQGIKEKIRMLGVMEDITQKKDNELKLIQNNEQLKKANKELDSFVYIASHDLRAPIASLLGLINVARLEKPSSTIEKLLQMQEKTLTKLDSFISDIVDYSRNARLKVEAQPVHLQALIEETLEHISFLENFKKTNISRKLNLEVAFYSDVKRLQIILNNLLSNAIKYYDRNKTNHFINIEATVNLKEAILTIEDNGEGIDDTEIDKIFNMFYRASEKSSGSGLGLYIVKETIDKLNGRIEVESAPDKGTKFTIKIPNQLT